MFNKKILLTIIFLVSIISFLSACVNETTIVDIGPDGGRATQEQIITKEVYESLISFGAKPTDFTTDGWKIDFYTENNIEYVKISKSQDFESLSELNVFLKELVMQDTDSSASNQKKYFYEIKVSTDEINKLCCIEGKLDSKIEATAYTSCKIKFKFPGEIINYNIGEKVDANTIEIDMLDAWKNKPYFRISITSKIDEKPKDLSTNSTINNKTIIIMVLGVIILIQLVLNIVLLILLRIKRPAKFKKDVSNVHENSDLK